VRQSLMLKYQLPPKTRQERSLHQARAKEPTLLPSSPDSGPSLTSTSSHAPSSLPTTRCRCRAKLYPLQRIHSIQQRCKSLRQTSQALQLPVACRTRQGIPYKGQSRYMRIVSTQQVTLRALSLDLHQGCLATSRPLRQIAFSLACTVKAARHSWSERQVITARAKHLVPIKLAVIGISATFQEVDRGMRQVAGA